MPKPRRASPAVSEEPAAATAGPLPVAEPIADGAAVADPAAPVSDEPPRGAQSIHRAMDVFVAVGEHDTEGIRLKDVAQITGLPVATAHRLLNALVWDQMVTYDSYSKRYSLGVRFHAMTDAARFGRLRRRFMGALRRISEATGDMVYLYLPLATEIICVERIDAGYDMRGGIREKGSRLPMGIGAAGIAMLAAMPPEQATQVLEANAARYPEYGFSTATVTEAVAEARRNGYGLNRNQVMRGVTGVGIVILDAEKAPEAAITVVAPSARLGPDRITSVARLVQAEVALGARQTA